MIPVDSRAYQNGAIENIRSAFREGHKRVLLQMPTGTGKTLTAAMMIAGSVARGNRALFVAHRIEIIDQTVTAFARLGILTLGVVRAGDRRSDPKQPIQVCSIQTLARRGKLDAGVVLIDEAHRSCAESYTKHLFEAYPDAHFVGLSATPGRTDGKPLGAWWTALIKGTTYAEAIAAGYLVEPLVYSLPLLADMSTVRTTAGDYNAEDLEAAVNKSALIGDVVREWKAKAGDRRTVVFAVSVAHSRAIVQQFVEAGVIAEHLDGTTPVDERRAILKRLEQGATRVVCNVGVLTEGWDCPPVKCLVLACPTKSVVKYLQMAGRVLRPWEGVQPVILDHGGNVDRVVNGEPMGLPHVDREWSLTDKPKLVGAAPSKACGTCFAMIPASCRSCPHCAEEQPIKVSPPPPESLTHVELVLRGLDKLGDDKTDPKLAHFRGLAKMAAERGWKPGAVNYRYEEKFGTLPPMAWWRALKKAHKSDAEWVAKVEAKIQAVAE